MKKIVALVLALVLALSLATVAFAADESYFAAKVGGMKLTGVTLKEVKAAGEKNVAVYAPVVTVNGKEIPMALNLVEATDADYDYVFVSGKEVTYLKNSINGQYTGEAKAVAGVAAADATCGDIVVAKDVALYEMNGKYYKAVGSWNLRTVLGNATKDVVKEAVEAVTFTKADWEKAVTDYFYTESKKTDAGIFNPAIWSIGNFASNIEDIAEGIYKAAKLNYAFGEISADRVTLNNLFDAIVETLYAWTDDADLTPVGTNTIISENISGAFRWIGLALDDENNIGEHTSFARILQGLSLDIKDEVVAKVLEALDFASGYSTKSLKTDAKYDGHDFRLNVAREIGKQATSVKALALVDGKLITLAAATASTKLTKSYDTKTGAMTPSQDGDYYVVPHKYAADYATVAGKTALTKVYCETCGAEFDFVVGDETAATEKFGAGNFENITNEFKYAFTTKFLGKHSVGFNWDTMSFEASWLEGTGYTWNMFDDAARAIKTALDGKQLYIGTAAAAETEVESAKTFDAGVALYAGMALMSVAGSAVVIGKKKEF